MRLFLVLIGGGLGSAARYLTSTFMAEHFGGAFPWGTFTVNVLGAFVIGLVATLADERGVIAPQTRLFLVVGILGGFTTFSSFSLESWRLAEQGELRAAALNVLGNVTLSLVAVFLGIFVARSIEG